MAHVVNLAAWDAWSWGGALWCGRAEDGFLWCSAASGVMAQAVFSVIALFASARLRQSTRFNYFWTTHHLGLLLYLILLLHGRDFWKWLVGPILGYMLDRYHRRTNAIFSARVVSTAYVGQDVIQVRQ